MTYTTKDNWKHKQFSTGMMRDTNEWKARFDLCLPLEIPYEEQLLTRFAQLMGRWAVKYTERNREKAWTLEEFNRFKESAIRHFMQWFNGEKDEDHAAAVLFNIMWAEYVLFKLSLLWQKKKNEI